MRKLQGMTPLEMMKELKRAAEAGEIPSDQEDDVRRYLEIVIHVLNEQHQKPRPN